MTIIATCRTEDCSSFGRPTKIVDPSAQILCGWCNVEISDKVEVPAEPVLDAPAS